MTPTRHPSLFIVLGALLWCAGFMLAPMLLDPFPSLARGLYAFYGEICHQLGDRSLHVGGQPVAVCARCFAVYCGFLAGAAFVLMMRPRLSLPLRLVGTVALAPMLVDVVAGMTGISSPSMVSRILTGGWFGLIGSFFLIPIAMGALRELNSARRVPDVI